MILGGVLWSWVDPTYRGPIGRFLFRDQRADHWRRSVASCRAAACTLMGGLVADRVAFIVLTIVAGVFGLR